MSTSPSDAEESSASPAPDEAKGVNPWVVRLFLILAFGVAFGIEGMTLIRSYLIDGENEAEEQVAESETTPIGIGADLLPETDVSERVAQMRIRARSGGPWVFRFVVTVVNEGEGNYRLAVRDLRADDGTVFDDVYDVSCPPGDSTRLVATWPIGPDARPQSLAVAAEVRGGDSTRTVRRRVTFGHIPVQMER